MKREDEFAEALARLLKRQEELEERLVRIEQVLGIARVQRPADESRPDAAQSLAHPGGPPPERTGPAALETRMGLTWINRAGVITLILAIGFFFKYAVDNRWIGPAGRVSLGLLAGLIALGVAELLWRARQVVFAQGLTGAGIAILYLSFYAAFGFYHLVPAGLAFALMALNTAAAGLLALRYNAQAIALLGLLGGYLTPVLLTPGEDRPWLLFSYLLLLNAGALGMARIKDWSGLELLALVATTALYFSWLFWRWKPEHRFTATFWLLTYYGLFASRRTQSLVWVFHLLAGLAVLRIWTDRPLPLLALLAALACTGLVIADRRRWPATAIIAFAAFWIPYSVAHASFMEPRPVAAAVAFLTVAFFLFLGWIPWQIQVRQLSPQPADLLLLALNGGFYFGACYSLLAPEYRAWVGALSLALAGLHFAVGRELWRVPLRGSPDLRAVWIYMGIAVAFLTLAVPVQLAGFRVTMAWALESAALGWIGVRIRQQRVLYAAAVVFGLVLLRLAVFDSRMYPLPTAYAAIFNARFLTFLTAAACFWLMARWTRVGSMALGTCVAGHFVMIWGLTLEVLGWAARATSAENLTNLQSTSMSILLAAYSVLLVALGVAVRSALNRILGLGLIGAVVLKLYFYDVWLISRMYRVAAFAGLGVLLLVTSYLYSRYRSSIEGWWRDGRTH